MTQSGHSSRTRMTGIRMEFLGKVWRKYTSYKSESRDNSDV
jgi:hypothetical protein